MKLIFATNNKNKLIEVQQLLGNKFELVSPVNFKITEDIPEDFETLEENALQKARYIFNKTEINCFADDTGLEVEALNGAPGVYSARYAGEDKNHEKNIDLLLENLKTETNRKAQFRTVIALIISGTEYLFEGIVRGSILTQRTGTEGFGYDSVFLPEGHNLSFAQMSLKEKNKLSHRGRAINKLTDFLHKYDSI